MKLKLDGADAQLRVYQRTTPQHVGFRKRQTLLYQKKSDGRKSPTVPTHK
jgi:hypothetical protein